MAHWLRELSILAKNLNLVLSVHSEWLLTFYNFRKSALSSDIHGSRQEYRTDKYILAPTHIHIKKSENQNDIHIGYFKSFKLCYEHY